jgi:hypothetical protein
MRLTVITLSLLAVLLLASVPACADYVRITNIGSQLGVTPVSSIVIYFNLGSEGPSLLTIGTDPSLTYLQKYNSTYLPNLSVANPLQPGQSIVSYSMPELTGVNYYVSGIEIAGKAPGHDYGVGVNINYQIICVFRASCPAVPLEVVH